VINCGKDGVESMLDGYKRKLFWKFSPQAGFLLKLKRWVHFKKI